MPYKLEGRNVLVTGGSRGIGEAICEKFAEQGCNVAINYLTSVDKAKELAEKLKATYGVKVMVVQGNTSIEADCVSIIEETKTELGGLDIIISNAGYTRFSTFTDLNAATNDDWDTCYAVNVKAQIYLMRAAESTLKSNPDGGVFTMTSSVAGIYPYGSSMPYSVTKAAQLHTMRCLARSMAPAIRVNAVLPGLVVTEWALRYGTERIDEFKDTAWLKKETNIDDVAQAYIDIAENTSMTGQKIQVDSGLANV